MTPGIKRTGSVLHGDPCAAELFGAALDTRGGSYLLESVRLEVVGRYL